MLQTEFTCVLAYYCSDVAAARQKARTFAKNGSGAAVPSHKQ